MKITFIGGGNMAEAIISGIKANKIACEILVSEPIESRRKILEKKYGVMVNYNNNDLLKESVFVLLAIKPQIFPNIAKEIKLSLKPSQTIISIMAGISIENLTGNLNHKNIIRVMPNTPSQIGKGCAVWMPTKEVEKNKIDIFREILKSCGSEIQVDSEKNIDIATAISGSGPAYIFLFLQTLINSATSLGLDKAVAKKISVETFLGSAYLARNRSKSLKELIEMVTSPGGTTEAGISVLKSKGFSSLVNSAVLSAYKRGIEISKGKK